MSANTVNQTTGALSKFAGLYNSQKIDTMYAAFPAGASSSNKLVSDSAADEKISAESQVIFEVMGQQGAKNVLPLSVSAIKSRNTSGVWSENSYASNGITATINTDANGNVVGIKFDGTATSRFTFYLTKVSDISRYNSMILNGNPSISFSICLHFSVADFP